MFRVGLRADMSIVKAGMFRELMQDEYSGSEVEESEPEESEAGRTEADEIGAEYESGQKPVQHIGGGIGSIGCDCRECTWTPHALPKAPNCDGRPVWEPPIFEYSQWIGEEYEKKREAMLKYLDNDAARTTAVMDLDTEADILDEYWQWIRDSFNSTVDPESRKFLRSLWLEVAGDYDDVGGQWRALEGGMRFKKNEDGTYTAGTDEELWPFPEQSFHNTQNITSTTSDHAPSPNRVASINDEDDTRSWLTTTTSSSSSFIADTRPLALRLRSLPTKSTFLSSQDEGEDWNTSSDEESGVD